MLEFLVLRLNFCGNSLGFILKVPEECGALVHG